MTDRPLTVTELTAMHDAIDDAVLAREEAALRREERAAEPDSGWLPNGGHTGPMCAYAAGMSHRCTCE